MQKIALFRTMIGGINRGFVGLLKFSLVEFCLHLRRLLLQLFVLLSVYQHVILYMSI